MSQKKRQMLNRDLLSGLFRIQMRSWSQMRAPLVKGCTRCRRWAYYLSNVTTNEDWSASRNNCICWGLYLARHVAVAHRRQKGVELCADQTRLRAHKDYCCFVSRVPVLLLDGREHKLETFVESTRTYARRAESAALKKAAVSLWCCRCINTLSFPSLPCVGNWFKGLEMKRSAGLFLSECKSTIIAPHTRHGPLQTTQTALPKPTDSPDPANKSIICSNSLSFLLPAVSVRTSLLSYPLFGSPKLRHHFPPPVFPFHPPCNFPRFVHIFAPLSSHLEPLIVSRIGWNIPRETSGTLKSVCTFTHRRNCSRKVASVQPIRQGFIGLVRAFLHMALSCLESNWNQGSHLNENQKKRGEIIHFGLTHFKGQQCPSWLPQ